MDNKSIARDSADKLLSDCRSRALGAIGGTSLATDLLPSSAAEAAVSSLMECVERSVKDELERHEEEIAFQAEVRAGMAELMPDYTCGDPDINTTEPVSESKWTRREVGWGGQGGGRGGRAVDLKRKVNVMLDRPSSKVHVVENFISEDECRAWEAAAGAHERVVGVSKRVYEYASRSLNLELARDVGQEDPTFAVHEGGTNDDSDDSDDDSDAIPNSPKFVPGDRVATVIFTLRNPEIGGRN